MSLRKCILRACSLFAKFNKSAAAVAAAGSLRCCVCGSSPISSSIRCITCSPFSLSLPLFNAVRGRSGLRRIGTHEKREREGLGRAVAALRFACSSEGSCVCVVVEEEEEACSECQQIRKCLLSCLYSPTNVDMPFRSPSPWDCLTLYGERYCRPNYLVRGCRSGPVVSLGAPSAARTPFRNGRSRSMRFLSRLFPVCA